MLFPKSASRSTRRWLLLAALLLIAAGLAIRILDGAEKPESGAPAWSSGRSEVGPETKPVEAAIPEAATLQKLASATSDGSTANSASVPAAPHRAPATLRQQDRQRLQDDPDLGAFANELKARADSGDADAAMALADLFAMCSRVSGWRDSDSGFRAEMRDYTGILGLGDEQFALLEATHLTIRARCAQWSQAGSSEQLRSAESWGEAAAALGHPGAQLSSFGSSLRQDNPAADVVERARQAGLELLGQRDPLDLIRHTSDFSALSPYDWGGFAMAACLLDPICGPDPDAFVRDHLAVGWFFGRANYQRLLYLGPRDRWIADRQAEEIVALWRAGRFDLILPSDRSSSGGGG